MYKLTLLAALSMAATSTFAQDKQITLDNKSTFAPCVSYECALENENVSFAVTSRWQVGVFNVASARIACEIAQDMGIANDVTITITSGGGKTISECSQ